KMIDLKSRVLRTLMPRRARHVVSCDTYAPAALSKCFSSILIRYQYDIQTGSSTLCTVLLMGFRGAIFAVIFSSFR
ncbi:MAG: hypothetical protein K6G54_01140, partial [Oscillospiraceae bacterium]|nr:hypothetical protein [Oscillospiraceae bacterium]